MREHNRIASILSYKNRYWDDEKIYEEARSIVGATVQHIAYREFLPVVLGSHYERYSLNSNYHYDPTVDATISNEFATAAFRFGHTLIPRDFIRYSPRGSSPLSLHDTFFDPSTLYGAGSTHEKGTDPLVVGMTQQISEAADGNLVDAVRNRLFGDHLDLAALNIQRGRDHGIPGYNSYREFCGLRKVNRFSELGDTIFQDVIAILQSVYR